MAAEECAFECAVCLDVMDDPRVLPCGHSFCLKCLKQTAPTTTTCPLCLTEHQGRVSDFPKNYGLSSAIDVVRKSSLLNLTPTTPLCDCSQKAEQYCEDCNVFLCAQCVPTEHPPIRVLATHAIVNVTKRNPKSRTGKCRDHPKENFRYFCQNCHSLLCRDCVILKHQGHTLLTIDDAATQKRQEISTISREPVKGKMNNVDQNLKQMREQKESLEQQIRVMEVSLQKEEEKRQQLVELDKALNILISTPSDIELLTSSYKLTEEIVHMCSKFDVCVQPLSPSSSPISPYSPHIPGQTFRRLHLHSSSSFGLGQFVQGPFTTPWP